MKKTTSLISAVLFTYVLLTTLFLLDITSHAAEIILVNKPLSAQDTRYEYPETLLKKIIGVTENQYGKAYVQQTELHMKRDRTFVNLIKGDEIHVMAEAPKPGWETELIPIRIPIRKGIQGYRTFLILKKNQAMLSKVNTIEKLKKIPTGSGKQWSTTRVLMENGFNVITGLDYEGLFKMLTKGRFITFGRGINETPLEYSQRKDLFPDLAIEQDLLLYIPLPTYFFVTPKKPELAIRIEKGLITLIENGAFDEFFNKHFEEIIKSANLNRRKVFKINNPNLSTKTPFDVKKFWYQYPQKKTESS